MEKPLAKLSDKVFENAVKLNDREWKQYLKEVKTFLYRNQPMKISDKHKIWIANQLGKSVGHLRAEDYEWAKNSLEYQGMVMRESMTEIAELLACQFLDIFNWFVSKTVKILRLWRKRSNKK